MIFRRLSRWMLCVAAIVAAVAVMGVYFWRDLHLTDIKTAKLPDMVVENIRLERDINGDHWTFISPMVEHRDGIIYGKSLDVTIGGKDGTKTKILAVNGTFARSNNDLTLERPFATYIKGDKKYFLKSGSLYYKAADEMWNLSNDVVLSQGKVRITGKTGYYAARSGDCEMSGGCTATLEDN